MSHVGTDKADVGGMRSPMISATLPRGDRDCAHESPGLPGCAVAPTARENPQRIVPEIDSAVIASGDSVATATSGPQ
jgi:hypothetical protein